MEKTRLDLEIERALRSNDDALAEELMRQRDARRLTPRPIVKAPMNAVSSKRKTGTSKT